MICLPQALLSAKDAFWANGAPRAGASVPGALAVPSPHSAVSPVNHRALVVDLLKGLHFRLLPWTPTAASHVGPLASLAFRVFASL